IGKVTEATVVAHRPENANPAPTAWNGYGAPGFPSLTRRTYFCRALEHERQLLAEEITAYNAITRPGQYGPEGRFRVRVTNDELFVSVDGVDTIEGRMSMPPLRDVLKTIVSEQTALVA